ncbi:MAG: hypothetical protein JNN20_06695 [Betaproteobacteria bacterium]|nr:hypothetical protein [Betaproteobacteria bacterium]
MNRSSLTVGSIASMSDDDLLTALFDEVGMWMSAALHDELDEFVRVGREAPTGIWAMAMTYQLDVSMALDDLGWHFANWCHRGYCEETGRALKELEAGELSDIFARAYSIVGHQWDQVVKLRSNSFGEFADWYNDSELEATLNPLNQRWWELCSSQNNGLFRYWLLYARKYPEHVVSDA